MKKTLFILTSIFICLSIGVFCLVPRGAEAAEVTHVCPGSGESCNLTVTVDGKRTRVRSVKDVNGSSITIDLD